MTGFASMRSQTAAGELAVTLRSVNGRNLDLHFHLGGEFAQFENDLRAMLKRKLGRGHVEIRMSIGSAEVPSGAALNLKLASRYLATFQVVSETFGLDSRPDLNHLFTLPGMFGNAPDLASSSLSAEEVLATATRCADDLNRFREREGAELVEAIRLELGEIEAATERMAAIRLEATDELRDRLEDRLAALLREVSIPPARLIEEAAILADRSDVQEELTRLTVHSGEVRRMLAEGGGMGKRLDFLLQEMNRETNTILSKTSGIGETGIAMTNLGIGVKVNIERIREQALNLE